MKKAKLILCVCGWKKMILQFYKSTDKAITTWSISGMRVTYDFNAGIFSIGEERYEIGKEIMEFSFLLDDVIFEVTANHGIMIGVFELQESKLGIQVDATQFEILNVYHIN